MGYKFNPFTGNLDLAGFPANGVVSGSGSSVDNTIVRFDGTTGTVIQSSGVTIDDSNNIVTTGTVTSGGNIDNSLTANRAVATNGTKQLVSSSTTDTELSYVNGVTSAIQTQLNNKQPLDSTLTALAAYNTNGLITQTAPDTFTGRTITGSTKVGVSNGNGVAGNPTLDINSNSLVDADINSAAAITLSKLAALTADRALQSSALGVISVSSVTATELGYVSGVTSAIQTQLNAKQSTALTSAHILVGNGSNLATDVAVSGDLTVDNTGNFQIASGTIVNADINASAAIDATKIADGSVTNTEFQYINSVTSNVQTQIDNITSGTTPLSLTSAHIFVGNASNQATNVAVSGDLTLDNTGNFQIVSGTIVNADINASAAIDASKIANGSVSNTEFQYLDGVTSAIQTQLNGKQTTTLTSAHILVGNGSNLATDVAVSGDLTVDNTGNFQISAGTIVNADINASAAIDASKIADGSVSNIEFQYLDGVSSSIQTQLNGKQSTALTSAHILVGNGSNLATDVVVSGDLTLDNTGNFQIASGVIVNADINAAAAIDATKIANGSVSNTEFQYLDGVTSAIQTQLDARLLKASGDINETSFTAADNQVAAANVTGLAFANGTVRSFRIHLSIVRASTYTNYELVGIQRAADWIMDQSYVGDVTGLTFTITTAGQVQYTSTSTGSTALLKFRALTTSV